MIKVKVLGGREYVINASNTLKVKDVLKKLGLKIEEYIVTKSGEVITEEDIVEDGDELILYPVVSGG